MTLTLEEAHQVYAAVKPIFDGSGGDPEATKDSMAKSISKKYSREQAEEVLFPYVDFLVKLQTEKNQGGQREA